MFSILTEILKLKDLKQLTLITPYICNINFIFRSLNIYGLIFHFSPTKIILKHHLEIISGKKSSIGIILGDSRMFFCIPLPQQKPIQKFLH